MKTSLVIAVLVGLLPSFPLAFADGKSAVASPTALHGCELPDQFGTLHTLKFPRERPVLLLVGDRKGVEEVDVWVAQLKKRWGHQTDILGVADVRGVPGFLRERVTTAIRKARPKPVMLDFDGAFIDQLPCTRKVANLFVTTSEGKVVATVTGSATDENLKRVGAALEPLLP